MRESFHNAFWSSLTDDLKLATPCYTRVIRVLIEVCDGIKDLAGESEGGNINEVIDAEHIKERVETGNYTFVDAASMFKSIVGIIQRIQSPKRDTETKEMWKELEEKIATATVENGAEVTCKVLEFLLGRVNALRIDAANARLRLIAPVIKDHGVDYERGKFADKIRDGTLTTERTTAWLHTTLDSAAGLADQVRSGSTVAALDLHAIAMISLINTTENITVTAEKVPETLLFDVSRLNKMKAEMTSLVCTKALLASITVTKDAAMLDNVCAAIEGMEAGAPLDISTLGLPEAIVSRIGDAVEPEGRVSKLFRDRLVNFLKTCVVNGPPATANDIFPFPMRSQLPKAYSERADKFIKSFCRLSSLNRVIHAETYNGIIHRHLGME